MGVKRVWHGWTTPENAQAYEDLLKSHVFPGIEAKKLKGYRSIELFRRAVGDEVEFITIMDFDTLDAVKDFVGENYETVYVPEKARAILKRFDQTSQHYDLIEMRNYLACDLASLCAIATEAIGKTDDAIA